MKKVATKVREAIMKLPEEHIFRYTDLPMCKGEEIATMKEISRMRRKGLISRFKKGMYYRPRISSYSRKKLPLSMDHILETYLQKDGRKIGYITGLTLYNRLGLTTQHTFVFEIASHFPLSRLDNTNNPIKINPVKSYAEVTDQNYKLLQFLDLLLYFKFKVLDLHEPTVINFFIKRLREMEASKRKKLVALSLSYPPRVRAFLGALLEYGGMKKALEKLRESLNPLSTYRLHTSRYNLPTAKKWNLHDDLARKQSDI